MAMHLAGKVARLMGDLRTIFALVDLIDHEMEKRIVARHAWIKLEALLNLLPRLKNEYRINKFGGDGNKVAKLELLIARLRKDIEGSPIGEIRDALAAHALKLNIKPLNEAWLFMGETTFGVLNSDINDIEAELAVVGGSSHVVAGTAQVDASWSNMWRNDDWLGDPTKPRLAIIYPALATANIAGIVAGGHPAQDATIRAIGLATFLRQTQFILGAVQPGSIVERNLLEMMVNDYVALWELLFDSHVRNDYGQSDVCVLDHWSVVSDPWEGAACLAALLNARHSKFEQLRKDVRNKISAHIDPDIEIWKADVAHWPLSRLEIVEEVGRVVESFIGCARLDIRSRTLALPPTRFRGDVVGLTGQTGLSWDEN